MEKKGGATALGLIIALLIIIAVLALALPRLLRSTTEPSEAAAISTLKEIAAAQAEYHAASRMYGSMGKLANSKFLGFPGDSFKSKGYDFYHSTNGSGRVWCAVAVPEEGKTGRVLAVNESGEIWHGVAAGACYMGTLDTAGGSPLR